MKKILSATVIICLLMISACQKVDTPPTTGAGGTWSLNNISYAAISCVGDNTSATLTATNTSNQSAVSISSVTCNFYGALPTVSGTYAIIDANGSLTSSRQVSIVSTVGTSGVTYLSKAGQNIAVTVSQGKILVSGSGISMYVSGSPGSYLSPIAFANAVAVGSTSI